MAIPTDRLLIMIIVATGLAVVVGGWAGGLVHAEATGWEEIALRAGLGVLFFVILFGIWSRFTTIDEEQREEGA